MFHLHLTDARTALALAAAAAAHYSCCPPWGFGSGSRRRSLPARPIVVAARADPSSPRRLSISPESAALAAAAVGEGAKPTLCTADELHYAPVPGAQWRLALWRYRPPPEAPRRNHALVLLSGVGTNAIGFDLSPGASFARHMSNEGFDTWIIEVRGAGLSMRESEFKALDMSNKPVRSDSDEVNKDKVNGALSLDKQSVVNAGQVQRGNERKIVRATWDEPQLVMRLTDTFRRLADTFSGYVNDAQLRSIYGKFFDSVSKLLEDARLTERLNEVAEKISGLLEAQQNSTFSDQIRDLSQRLVKIIEEGQITVSPQLFDLQERFSATIEEFQRQLELIISYDWDFDHYLEEDIPAAMDYIRLQSGTRDGKLLAIGHSMGGILLYALIAKCGFEGVEPGLAAVVTLASSVDYTTSKSSLKLLLPLADPAQALNVPAVPLGALMAAAYPLSSRPPYVFAWLNPQISAQDMMNPELFSKLVLNNFCTVPAKVLLQLTTAFREGGLRNRTGTFCYKDHLDKCTVPILAMAGDKDLICPPEAVYETIKLIPQHMVNYVVFGKPDGPHYAHYDLVGGRLAAHEVYPCIIEFLSHHDKLFS